MYEHDSIPELAPLLEPDAVEFSFNSPGWYMLAGLLFLILVSVFVVLIKRYRKRWYRRHAIGLISELSNKIFDNKTCFEGLKKLNEIVKIVAIQSFGRQKVASLNGNDWFVFLNQTSKLKPFGKYLNSDFATCYYHNNKEVSISNEQLHEYIELNKKWIKKHDI